MRKYLPILTIFLFILSQKVQAVGVGFGILTLEAGYTGSLDTTYQYSFLFNNDFSSTANIVSISIDGATAYDHPLTWRRVDPFVSNNPELNINVSGLDTSLVVLNNSGPGQFSPGDWIKSDPWVLPYPGPNDPNVPASDLLGLTVTFNFSDNSTWVGTLENVLPPPGSPFPNAIATVQPVPVPAAVWLLGSALLGLIGVTRRQKS